LLREASDVTAVTVECALLGDISLELVEPTLARISSAIDDLREILLVHGGNPRPSMRVARRRFDALLVLDTIEREEWNIKAAARTLGLSRPHVYNLMRGYGICRPPECAWARSTSETASCTRNGVQRRKELGSTKEAPAARRTPGSRGQTPTE
jgi:hypothetical protein